MSEIWVKESPVHLVAGAEPIYTITFTGATTVASATMSIYKNGTGTDLSATNLSGSVAYSGNVLTLKKLTALIGGNTYTVSVTCTVDGVVEVRKLDVKVQKAQTGQ